MHLNQLFTLALSSGLASAGCFESGSHQRAAAKEARDFCKNIAGRSVGAGETVDACHNLAARGWLSHAKYSVSHVGPEAREVPGDCAERMAAVIGNNCTVKLARDADGWTFSATSDHGLCGLQARAVDTGVQDPDFTSVAATDPELKAALQAQPGEEADDADAEEAVQTNEKTRKKKGKDKGKKDKKKKKERRRRIRKAVRKLTRFCAAGAKKGVKGSKRDKIKAFKICEKVGIRLILKAEKRRAEKEKKKEKGKGKKDGDKGKKKDADVAAAPQSAPIAAPPVVDKRQQSGNETTSADAPADGFDDILDLLMDDMATADGSADDGSADDGSGGAGQETEQAADDEE